MIDRIILWLIKNLILIYDRDGTLLSHSFPINDRLDYSIIKTQDLDDKWIHGTCEHEYPNAEEAI